MADKIKVVIRVRPLIKREIDQGLKELWSISNKEVRSLKSDSGNTPYVFDYVFDPEETSENVYDEVGAPIVEAAMQGFHGTIFAYGQTASGKTHTMMGDTQMPGIIPRAIEDIFNNIETSPTREFLLRVSYVEIYNENVTDLLGEPGRHLDVRENQTGTVFIENVKEEFASSSEEILAAMQRGEANRHFGRTNMNEKSSRSHTIFRVVIESKESKGDDSKGKRSVDGAVTLSHLNLVDLAGSECAKTTGATGQRLAEGSFINKSLTILGQVMLQLSERSAFINYRDSKLTRILQNSLGGNSKTVMICNITKASLEETNSTLRFATNAKKIRNKPVKNEVMSDEAMLARYKNEISKLKKELGEIRDNTEPDQKGQELLEKMTQEASKKQQDAERCLAKLTRLICVSSQHVGSTQDQARKVKRRETWCPGKGAGAYGLGKGLPRTPNRPSLQSLDVGVDGMMGNPVLKLKATRFLSPTSPTIDEVFEKPETVFEEDRSDFEKDKEITDLRFLVEEKSQEIEVLTETLENVMVDHGQINDALHNQISALQRQLAAVKEPAPPARQSVSFACNVSETELNKMKADLARYEQDLKVSMQVNEELLSRVEGINEKETKYQLSIENLEEKLLQCEFELHKKTAEFEELEEFTRKEKDLCDASILARRASNERDDLDQAMEQLAELESEKNDLQKQLRETQENLDKNEESLFEMRQDLTAGQTDLADSRQTIDALRDQLDTLKDRPQRKEMDDLDQTEKEDLDQALEQLARDTETIVDLEREKNDLQSQLRETQENLDKNENSLIEMRKELTAGQTDLAESQLTIDTLKDQLDTLKDQPQAYTEVDSDKEKEQLARANQFITELESENSDLQKKLMEAQEDLDKNVESQIELHEDLAAGQADLAENQQTIDKLKDQLQTLTEEANVTQMSHREAIDKLKGECDDLTVKLESAESSLKAKQQEVMIVGRQSICINQHSSEDLIVDRQKQAEREAFMLLEEKYAKLLSETEKTKGKLLSDENRDIDSNKRIEEMEKARHEALAVSTQRHKEDGELIDKLTREVQELKTSTMKADGDCQLAEHRYQKSCTDIENLKQEMRTLENLQSEHSSSKRRQDMDPDRMLDRIRKLEFGKDLAEQRCDKFQVRIKQLEGDAKKTEDVQFERNSLQGQLRETQNSLRQQQESFTKMRQQLTATHTELDQSRLTIDTLKNKIHKVEEERANLFKQHKKDSKKDSEKMQEEVRNLSDMLMDKDFEILRLGEKIEDLERKNENAHFDQKEKELHAHHTKYIAELENEKKELERQLRETQENLDKNEESAKEMRKELTTGQTDLAESQKTIDTLKDQLDTLKDQPQQTNEKEDLDFALNYIKELEEEKEQVFCDAEKIEELEREKDDLQRQLRDTQENLEFEFEMRKELTAGQTNIAESQVAVDTLKDQLQTLECEKNNLQLQLRETQEDLDKNKESVIEMRKELTAGQTELAESQQTIDTLRDQLDTVKEQPQTNESEDLDTALNYIQELEKEKEQLLSDAKTMENEKSDLQKQLRETEENLYKNEESLNEMRKMLTTSQTDLTESQQTIDTLKNQLHMLKDQPQTNNMEDLDKAFEYIKELEKEKEQLVCDSKNMAELEYEKNELQRQLRETQENLNKNEESQLEMSKELTAGRTDLAQSLRTIDTLRAQLDTFKDETQTKYDVENKAELECENSDLQQQLRETQENLHKNEASLIEMRKELTAGQTELAESQEIIDALKDQLDTMKDQLQAKNDAQNTAELECGKNDLQKQLRETLENLDKNEQSLIEIRKELTAGQTELAESRVTNDKLKDQLDMLKDQPQQTSEKEDLDFALNYIKELEEEKEHLFSDAKNREELESEKNDLQRQLKETQENVDKNEESLNEMRQELTTSQADLAQSQLTIDKLKDQLQTVEGKRDDVNETLQEKDEENKLLCEKAEVKTKDNEEWDEMMRYIEKLEVDREKLRKHCSELKREMEELSPEGYSFIKSQLELRENELEIWKDEHQKYAHNLYTMQFERDEQTKRADRLQKRMDEIEGWLDREDYVEERDQMRECYKKYLEVGVLVACRRELSDEDIKIVKEMALSDMRKMEPEGHMVALETENKQLKANVDFTQRKVEMLEEKVKKIREENKSLSDTTLQLQQQVMAVSSRQADTKDPKKPAGGKEDENLMAAQTKICALESELVQVTKSLKKKIVEAREEANVARQRNRQLHNEIRQLRNNPAEDSVLLLSQPAGDQKKNPDFETLQTENKELKTRIQSMKQDHRQIMDELRHATKHETKKVKDQQVRFEKDEKDVLQSQNSSSPDKTIEEKKPAEAEKFKFPEPVASGADVSEQPECKQQ